MQKHQTCTYIPEIESVSLRTRQRPRKRHTCYPRESNSSYGVVNSSLRIIKHCLRGWFSHFIITLFAFCGETMTATCDTQSHASPEFTSPATTIMAPREFMQRSGSSRSSLASSGDESTVILMTMDNSNNSIFDDTIEDTETSMSIACHDMSQRSLGEKWMMGDNAGPSLPMAPMEKLEQSTKEVFFSQMNSSLVSLSFSDYYDDGRKQKECIDETQNSYSYHPELEEEDPELAFFQKENGYISPRTPIQIWEQRQRMAKKIDWVKHLVNNMPVPSIAETDPMCFKEKVPSKTTVATQSSPKRNVFPKASTDVVVKPPQRTLSPPMLSMPAAVKAAHTSISPATTGFGRTISQMPSMTQATLVPTSNATEGQVVQTSRSPFKEDVETVLKPPQRTMSPNVPLAAAAASSAPSLPSSCASCPAAADDTTAERISCQTSSCATNENTTVTHGTRRAHFASYRPMSVATLEMAIDTVIRADEPPLYMNRAGKQRRLSFGYVLHQGFDKTQPACEILEGCLDRMDEWLGNEEHIEKDGEEGQSTNTGMRALGSTPKPIKNSTATSKPKMLKSILKKVKRRLSGMSGRRGSFFGNKSVQKNAPKVPNRRGSFQRGSWMPAPGRRGSMGRRGSFLGSSSKGKENGSESSSIAPRKPTRRRSNHGPDEEGPGFRRRGSFLSGLWGGNGGGVAGNTETVTNSSPNKPTRRRSWLHGSGKDGGKGDKVSSPTQPSRTDSFSGDISISPPQKGPEPTLAKKPAKTSSVPNSTSIPQAAVLGPAKPRRRTSWFGSGNRDEKSSFTKTRQPRRRLSWFGSNISTKVSRRTSADFEVMSSTSASSLMQPTIATLPLSTSDLLKTPERKLRVISFKPVGRRVSFVATTSPIMLPRTHRIRSEDSARRLSL